MERVVTRRPKTVGMCWQVKNEASLLVEFRDAVEGEGGRGDLCASLGVGPSEGSRAMVVVGVGVRGEGEGRGGRGVSAGCRAGIVILIASALLA